MREYEIAVIGSGPAAVAALDALDAGSTVAVVTGAVPSSTLSRHLHPKIRAVATERGEPAGVADILRTTGDGPTLFSTAAVGGLANYWGQQFVTQSPGDPWPRGIFSTYEDYLAECHKIEGLFRLAGGGPTDGSRLDPASYLQKVPRLLIGSACLPEAGLGAMRGAFRTLVEKKGATVIEARVDRMRQHSRGWSIVLVGGEEVRAKRIVLAAGVIGTALLVLRSWPDLGTARFHDHSPWMAFCLGLHQLLPRASKATAEHFNALTIERELDAQCVTFASIYDMRFAELNLLLASTIGATSALLRGWRTPPLSGLIRPVQVWTPMTETVVEVDAKAVLLAKGIGSHESDRDLSALVKMLKGNGVRTIRLTSTRPGYGFHYHSLDFDGARGGPARISQVLNERTSGSVTCVDASILDAIGCRPPTLTAMAAARRLTARSLLLTG